MEINQLYPIFMKLHQLNVLLVGAGNVGLEKLSFLLKSSPKANVCIVATHFIEEIKHYVELDNVTFIKEPYHSKYLTNKHIVIGATDNQDVNKQICEECHQKNILVNIADTPELCDFFLGGIVSKGNLKIAISTNGKSPTIAKQLRKFFEDIIPENIDEMLESLYKYRQTIKGDFQEKIEKIHTLTKSLISK